MRFIHKRSFNLAAALAFGVVVITGCGKSVKSGPLGVIGQKAAQGPTGTSTNTGNASVEPNECAAQIDRPANGKDGMIHRNENGVSPISGSRTELVLDHTDVLITTPVLSNPNQPRSSAAISGVAYSYSNNANPKIIPVSPITMTKTLICPGTDDSLKESTYRYAFPVEVVLSNLQTREHVLVNKEAQVSELVGDVNIQPADGTGKDVTDLCLSIGTTACENIKIFTNRNETKLILEKKKELAGGREIITVSYYYPVDSRQPDPRPDPDPTDPQNPQKPDDTQPSKKPGDTQPSKKPGDTQPSKKPGDTQPHKNPKKPGDTQPSKKPGDTQPDKNPGQNPAGESEDPLFGGNDS